MTMAETPDSQPHASASQDFAQASTSTAHVDWVASDELLESLATGQNGVRSVANAQSEISGMLQKAGILPKTAETTARALVKQVIEVLAQGGDPNFSFSVPEGFETPVAATDDNSSLESVAARLAQALITGDAAELDAVKQALSKNASLQEVGVQVLQTALAGGATPENALFQAHNAVVAAQNAIQNAATPLGDGVTAVLGGLAQGGESAATAAQSLTVGLNPAQSEAFLNGMLGSLAVGADSAGALAAAGQAARAQQSQSITGDVPISVGGRLVSTLAAGGDVDAALAAAGLGARGEGNGALAALTDSLTQGVDSGAALINALAAGLAATKQASSSSGPSDPLMAALSGNGDMSIIAAMVGAGSETGQAFLAALSTALADNASLQAALQSANSVAVAVSNQIGQSSIPPSAASQLAQALASGNNVSAVVAGNHNTTQSLSDTATSSEVAGSDAGRAFITALSAALSTGSSLQSALQSAENNASAANHQLASSSVPSSPASLLAQALAGGNNIEAALTAAGGSGDQRSAFVDNLSQSLADGKDFSQAAASAQLAVSSSAVVQLSAASQSVARTEEVKSAALSVAAESAPSAAASTATPPAATSSTVLQPVVASLVNPSDPEVINQSLTDSLQPTLSTHAASTTDNAATTSPETTTADHSYRDIIIEINHTPILSAPATLSYTDTAATDNFNLQSGVLAASDAEGATLTYGIQGGTDLGSTVSLVGAYGVLTVTKATGAYTFTPVNGAVNALAGNASESFTVSAGDGSLVGTNTLTINIAAVNDTPILSAPATLSYTDTAATDNFNLQSGVLAASDAEGATLTYGIQGGTDLGSTVSLVGAYGVLTVTKATGAYTFTPVNGAVNALAGNASESFTVSAGDGSLVGTNTLTINIAAVNDTPILSAPATLSYTDTAATDNFNLQSGVLAASDAEGATLTYGIQGGTDLGSTVSLVGAYGVLTVTKATGAYTFTPVNGAVNALAGNASESFTVSAGDGSLVGTNTLTINIAAVNDTPILSAPATLSYTDTAATDNFNLQSGVLAASDAEGATLTYGIQGGTDLGSTVSLVGAYGVLTVTKATGAYTFTPVNGAVNALAGNASESFTVSAGDGSLVGTNTLTINIAAVNDTPILSAPATLSYTDTAATDNFNLQSGVLAASDAEGATLTYGIQGGTDLGSTVSLVGAYGVLTVTKATGAYTFTPVNGAVNALAGNASESFTVSAGDGSLVGTNTLTINIAAVNDTPILSAPATLSYTDTAATDNFNLQSGVLAASDAEGATLTYGIQGGTDLGLTVSLVGAYGVLTVTKATGAYTFTPVNGVINALADNASESFTVSAGDGSLIGTNTLTINITAVAENAINNAPVLSGSGQALSSIIENPATNSGTQVSTILGSTATDIDSPNIGIAVTGATNINGFYQYSIDNGTSWQTISNASVGSALLLNNTDYVRFVPNINFAGINTGNITFKAWDESFGSHGGVGDTTAAAGGYGGAGSNSQFSSETASAAIMISSGAVLNASAALLPFTVPSTPGLLYLPGSSSYGAPVTFSSTDDSYSSVSSSAVFPNGFPYFNANSNIYIGTNGYITFGNGDSSFSSQSIAQVAVGISNNNLDSIPGITAFIAGLYADIVTFTGNVYYGESTDYVMVTYSNVAQYPGNNQLRDSFQILLHKLTDNNIGIELRYGAMQWSNGGTGGWSNGSNYGEVVESGSTNMINNGNGTDATYSNVGIPGVYVWEVTSSGVATAQPAVCDTFGAGTVVGTLSLKGTQTGYIPSLIDSAGGRFQLVQSGGQWLIEVAPGADSFTQSSYTVKIRAADPGNSATYTDSAFTVNVVLDPPLPAVMENTTNPQGKTISDLFSASHPSQVAVIMNYAEQNQGTWQYSTTHGTEWLTLNTGQTIDIILNPDDLLRFVPAPDWRGAPGNLLTQIGYTDENSNFFGLSYEMVSTSVTPSSDTLTTPNSFTQTLDGFSHVETANTAAPQPTDLMTLEAWLHFTESTPSGEIINNLSNNSGYKLWINENSFRLEFEVGNGAVLKSIDADAAVLRDNAWHHIAASYDNSSMKLYIDGVVVADQDGAVLQASAQNLSSILSIGDGITGELSEIGLWNSVRTQNQIVDDQSHSFSESGAVASWDFGNSPTSGSAALTLDGSGRIEVANTNALQINGALTIESWLQFGGATAGGEIVNALSNKAGYKLWVDENSGRLKFEIGNGSVVESIDADAASLSDHSWHHVAASYDGSAVKLYIDGAAIAGRTDVGPNALTQSSSSTLSMGGGLIGALNEVSLWSLARSQNQIIEDRTHSFSGKENEMAGYWAFDGNLTNASSSGATDDGALVGTAKDVSYLKLADTINVELNSANFKGMVLGFDAHNETLSYSAANHGATAHGTVTFIDNTFTYTPNSGHITQNDSFIVNIIDANAHTTTETITLNVSV
ncbi:hypothetical protein CCP2SC5_280011 [Azospirillaceae bacterium]